MAEFVPVIMAGVEVAKNILDFWKEKKTKPRPPPPKEVAKRVEADKEKIKPQASAILKKTMKHGLDASLSSRQFKAALDMNIAELSRPSIFYRSRLIEMNSVLNRGLGKIDLYYTLISRSSSKVKEIVLLQSRLLIPRINKDLNRFLAIMKKLDEAVLAEIRTSFCGAFTECESDLEAQAARLEKIQSIGADFSVSDIENWLHSYRDYVECCLLGVNKSITFT